MASPKESILPTRKKLVATAIFAGMVAGSIALLWRITPVKRIITAEVPLTAALSLDYWRTGGTAV